MKDVCTQFVCRECGNASWFQEICHGKPMESTCYCGSGKFLNECHGKAEQKPSAKKK